MGDPAIKAIRDLFDEWEATRLIPAIEAAVSKAVEQATAERDAKIAALEKQLSKTQEELRSTVIRLDQLESYSRRNCINISGVPEAAGERTDELVLDVARAAGVNMAPTDIDRSHRIGRPGDKPRNITARFVTHSARQRLLEARRNLSAQRIRGHPVLTEEALGRVFLSECLTQRCQHLLFVARRLRAAKKVWAAYSTNGRVKVRVTEGEGPKTIEDLSDLKLLVGEEAVQAIVESSGSEPRTNVTEAAAGPTPREQRAGTPAAANPNFSGTPVANKKKSNNNTSTKGTGKGQHRQTTRGPR